MPTLLDFAHAPRSDRFLGRAVLPLEGHSWLALLAGAATAVWPAEEPIGWELYGRRAIRRGRWKAVYLPQNPPSRNMTIDHADRWLLFDIKRDPGETRDLGKRYPERLAALVEAWRRYAREKGVQPPPDPR